MCKKKVSLKLSMRLMSLMMIVMIWDVVGVFVVSLCMDMVHWWVKGVICFTDFLRSFFFFFLSFLSFFFFFEFFGVDPFFTWYNLIIWVGQIISFNSWVCCVAVVVCMYVAWYVIIWWFDCVVCEEVFVMRSFGLSSHFSVLSRLWLLCVLFL